MFKTLTLGQKFSSKNYNEIENDLRIKLFNLQRECEEHKIAVLVTITGVDCAGRGQVMNMLAKWLDNKKLRTHAFWRKSEEEATRPDSWRYWIRLPQQGEFGVFYGGWYAEPIRMAAYGKINEDQLTTKILRHIERERTLADNNYVQAKFWFHLDKKEHSKRIKEREKEKTSYHFSPLEEKSIETYPKLVETASKVITMTDKDFSPWYIIDAYDKEFRNISFAKALIEVVENAIAKKKNVTKEIEEVVEQREKYLTILDRVDLNKTVSKEEYNKQINKLQKEVSQLTYEAYKEGISSTLVFEGLDAGGKGGAIRRIVGAVDTRIAKVIPIAAPSSEELAHHYLWRFWRHVPRDGFVTIYDRSWYGRVLVERVEGFSKPSAWKKAYSEINNFEEQLVENKNILLKFWLHVSPEEQLNRFKERQEVEWKQYKITDEDWRNRDKLDDYKVAADEMFLRTDTLNAPWHIIPGDSKYYARLEILTIYKNALLKALGKEEKIDEDEEKNEVIEDDGLLTAKELKHEEKEQKEDLEKIEKAEKKAHKKK